MMLGELGDYVGVPSVTVAKAGNVSSSDKIISCGNKCFAVPSEGRQFARLWKIQELVALMRQRHLTTLTDVDQAMSVHRARFTKRQRR